MNKLVQIIALFVVLSVSVTQGYNYVQFYGKYVTNIWQLSYCTRPATGYNYAYILNQDYTVTLYSYSDYYCQNIVSSQTFNLGPLPDEPWITLSLQYSLDFQNTGYYYYVTYGNGTNCNGEVNYAQIIPQSRCAPVDHNNPSGPSQYISCTSKGYTKTVYTGASCTGSSTASTFPNTYTCNLGQPGWYQKCIEWTETQE